MLLVLRGRGHSCRVDGGRSTRHGPSRGEKREAQEGGGFARDFVVGRDTCESDLAPELVSRGALQVQLTGQGNAD